MAHPTGWESEVFPRKQFWVNLGYKIVPKNDPWNSLIGKKVALPRLLDATGFERRFFSDYIENQIVPWFPKSRDYLMGLVAEKE